MDSRLACCRGGSCDDACKYDNAIVDGDVFSAAVAVSLWITWCGFCVCGGVGVSPLFHTTCTALGTYKRVCVDLVVGWLGLFTTNKYVALALLVLAFRHTLRCPCLRVCGDRAPRIPLALLAIRFVLCVFCCGGGTHTMLRSSVLAASCSLCTFGLLVCLLCSHISFCVDGLWREGGGWFSWPFVGRWAR